MMMDLYYALVLTSILIFLLPSVTSKSVTPSPITGSRTTVKKPMQRTVLFGFSGLRHDTLDKYNLPSLHSIANQGVFVKRVVSAFQTESLPAFATINTGLNPDGHGMLANNMRNSETGDNFDVSITNEKWWNAEEPIWIANQKSNASTGESCLCYWPGYDVMFGGLKSEHACPLEDAKNTYADPFKQLIGRGQINRDVMTFETRLMYAKKWLRSGDSNFIAVYFEEPLQTAIQYGYSSVQMKNAVQYIDRTVQHMLTFLREESMEDDVNFVVTGESGVTDLEKGSDVYLSDSVETSKYDIVDSGPIMSVYPQYGSDSHQIQNLLAKIPQVRIYNESSISSSFHYSFKTRTPPVVLSADEGVQLYASRAGVEERAAQQGFEGRFESTHSLLFARGPRFEVGVVIDRIKNTDIYHILIESLGLHHGEAQKSYRNKTLIDILMKKKVELTNTVATDHIRIVNSATTPTTTTVLGISKSLLASTKSLTIAIVVSVMLLLGVFYGVIVLVNKTVGCCKCKEGFAKVAVHGATLTGPTHSLVRNNNACQNRRSDDKKGAYCHRQRLLAGDDFSDGEMDIDVGCLSDDNSDLDFHVKR